MRAPISMLIAGVVAASVAHAQVPAPKYSPDDFAKAIGGTPCQDGQPRDAGGACPQPAEGATRGFTLLPQAQAPNHGHGGPTARFQPVRPARTSESSPLTDLRIAFRLGSAALLPEGEAQARAFAEALKDPRFSKTQFEIAGYTDITGSAEGNLELSNARAEAVRAFLVANGVDPSRLSAKGYGDHDLLHPDRPRDPSNRRVEARLLN
jgi:outer membrane protein OmpA-like peptidoglycan-associated protein